MNNSYSEYIIEKSNAINMDTNTNNHSNISSNHETNKISTVKKKKYKKLIQTILDNNNEQSSQKNNYCGLGGGEFTKVAKI